MFDFGESLCIIFDDDFVKYDVRLPPYVDPRVPSSVMTGLSGVRDGELPTDTVTVRDRGDGVRGILPPAVLVENMPVWDLTGVHTAVAIVKVRVCADSIPQSNEKLIYRSTVKSFDNRTAPKRLNLMVPGRWLVYVVVFEISKRLRYRMT